MKCPKCNTEMTKGNLYTHGMQWLKNDRKRGGFMETFGLSKAQPVVAWKCETCNKVELTIETTT
ncbi:MAG: PF20097 family protein [Candidatus Shapirobacteria bacterium]